MRRQVRPVSAEVMPVDVWVVDEWKRPYQPNVLIIFDGRTRMPLRAYVIPKDGQAVTPARAPQAHSPRAERRA